MLRCILETSHVACGVMRNAGVAVAGLRGGSGNGGRTSTSLRMIPCDRMNCFKTNEISITQINENTHLSIGSEHRHRQPTRVAWSQSVK